MTDCDFNFKIVLFGESGVGKSNILSTFVDNRFLTDSQATIGAAFGTKLIQFN